MMELKEQNERLFYKLLIDIVEELLPIVYPPTVGEAYQKYESIFKCPQDIYTSLKEKYDSRGLRILEVLKNWLETSIQVIIVTDGEKILGLGDLGCQVLSMGKLALYTTLGGVRPSAITMWKTEFVVKLLWLHFPPSVEEYYDFLHEFMSDVKQNYGEKILIQFEDFANHNAFALLAKYRTTHLVFNDDIQGTTSVVLAGIIPSLKLLEVHYVINILVPRCWRDPGQLFQVDDQSLGLPQTDGDYPGGFSSPSSSISLISSAKSLFLYISIVPHLNEVNKEKGFR
ncbi:hypothetical protein P3S67_004549 [Capsicum chacoense]